MPKLQEDIGLFLFSLMLSAEYLAGKDQACSLSMLKQELPSDFRELFSSRLKSLEESRFESMTEPQVLQNASSALSASVTKLLASHSDFDADTCYAAAVVKNLGLLICSWNYPAIFEKCWVASENHEQLSELLNVKLGFRPQLLALSMCQSWKINEEVSSVLHPSNSGPIESSDLISDSLAQLCQIGQTLASLSLGTLGEEQTLQASRVMFKLKRILGENFISILSENLENSFEVYRESFPNLIKFDPEKTLEAVNEKAARADLRNHYLSALPSPAEKTALEVYKELNIGQVSRKSISRVIRSIIPETSFSSGAIYLLDPPKPSLIPRLTIGPKNPADFSSVNYQNSRGESIVADAFWVNRPLCAESDSQHAEIAGVIGEVQRLGVLYLVFQEAHFKGEPLTCFQALQQLISDCLGVF